MKKRCKQKYFKANYGISLHCLQEDELIKVRTPSRGVKITLSFNAASIINVNLGKIESLTATISQVIAIM